MRALEPISILSLGETSTKNPDPLIAFLRTLPHVRVREITEMPEALTDAHLVVTHGTEGLKRRERVIADFVKKGGAWLHCVERSESAVPDVFGVQPGPVGPETELRILYTDRENSMAERLKDAFYVPGAFQELHITADNVETDLYADWHYSHRSMVVHRPLGQGHTACTTLQAFDHPDVQQIVYRLIRFITGRPFGLSLGVGILGYAPSVGRLHGKGCEATAGLEFKAACDLNKDRLAQARIDFPGIRCYGSGDALAEDPDIDLIIVATPPNTHADLCIRMMAAGKHVVCEKPLAICRRETDALVQSAEKFGVHLSCHQNRRFDVDYLAIRKAVNDGRIGDLFYLETFVGGFSHPCGYWHSHAPVSGGTTYDWGAHYLDWIVSLFPGPISAVVGTRHNRVWHDVSNADQERIQIRFAGGHEAEFIHSDIAAARKPKWYLLGTEGAVIGHWRDVTTYDPDPDLYFDRSDIPATEMPPELYIHRRTRLGTTDLVRPDIPRREPYAFHRNLADHLLTGESLAAPLNDSVKVVTILEAAARSMEKGGSVEIIDD
ncbi:hypothetical protein D3OALGA1CA_4676 [Olavius algarvensis associated proteobacterium Delta 3]|nr:hypothetical protein D3OALGB2SA_4867 [Olavius algarvensis associated proteobacterium Delta 3]CAB5155165.1 hypothetical protein D3OALGA1CA_4676 [Olavius algarvensis associated proteobacterium Delta 3]